MILCFHNHINIVINIIIIIIIMNNHNGNVQASKTQTVSVFLNSRYRNHIGLQDMPDSNTWGFNSKQQYILYNYI